MTKFYILLSQFIFSGLLLQAIAWPTLQPLTTMNDMKQPVSSSLAPTNELDMEQSVSDKKNTVKQLNDDDDVLQSVKNNEQFTSSDGALNNVIAHIPQSFISEEFFPDFQEDSNSTLHGSLQSNAIEHFVKTNQREESLPGETETSGVTEDTTFSFNQTRMPVSVQSEFQTNQPFDANSETMKKPNVTSQSVTSYEQDFDLLQSIWFQSTQKTSEVNNNDITESTPDPYQYDQIVNTVQIGNTHVVVVDEMDTSWNSTKLTITLQSHEDSVTTFWTYESNDTRVTGFLVTYRINKREHYDSSKLGKNVRSFTLHSLHEDEDYVICVHAMVNTTAVKEACAHWNESSMKIVVGIMAGILFLIPCIVVIIWILVKDRKVRHKMGCMKEKRDTIQEQKLMKFHKCQDEPSHCDPTTNGHTVVSTQNELHKTIVTEDHTDSEDELWKRQSRVQQSIASKDQKFSMKALPNNAVTSQREQ